MAVTTVAQFAAELNRPAAAQSEKGLARLEGKEYVMQDGDVVDFRFNV